MLWYTPHMTIETTKLLGELRVFSVFASGGELRGQKFAGLVIAKTAYLALQYAETHFHDTKIEMKPASKMDEKLLELRDWKVPVIVERDLSARQRVAGSCDHSEQVVDVFESIAAAREYLLARASREGDVKPSYAAITPPRAPYRAPGLRKRLRGVRAPGA